jgi:hypothetical protein
LSKARRAMPSPRPGRPRLLQGPAGKTLSKAGLDLVKGPAGKAFSKAWQTMPCQRPEGDASSNAWQATPCPRSGRQRLVQGPAGDAVQGPESKA